MFEETGSKVNIPCDRMQRWLLTDKCLISEERTQSSVVVQWLTNPTRSHEVVGSIPGHELWCSLQTRLRSGIAVALA